MSDSLNILGTEPVPRKSLKAWLESLTPEQRRDLKRRIWEIENILDNLIDKDFKSNGGIAQ